MGRVRNRLDDLGEGFRSTDPIQIAFGPQPLQDDRGIDPLAGVVEILQVLEKQPMSVVVEIVAANKKGHVVADVWLEEHAAKHRPLGFCADWLLAEKGKLRFLGISIPPPPTASAISVGVAAATSGGCLDGHVALLARTPDFADCGTRLPPQGAATGDPQKPWLFGASLQWKKSHGWLFPQTVSWTRLPRCSTAPPTPSGHPRRREQASPSPCRDQPPSADPAE